MSSKKIALFGAGKITKEILKSRNLSNMVDLIVDNNEKLSGNELIGKRILSINEIPSVKDFFYVITVYYSEIAAQLDALHLQGGVDYCSVDRWLYDISCEDIPLDNTEVYYRISNKKEYEAAVKKIEKPLNYERELEKFFFKSDLNFGVYKGFCDICNKDQYFRFQKYDNDRISWRESGWDMECSCNSRTRFTFSYVMSVPHENVYISEQVTPLYRELKKAIPNLIGSEFLDDKTERRGKYFDGIRNEDATALSFDDSSLDLMIYCDVFEHVPDYKKALEESYRCLNNGGGLFFTIPFNTGRDKSIQRAFFDERSNDVVHILPPQYHGNPLSEEGSLVFTDFGWDILDTLKEIGFEKANLIVYYSAPKAYFCVGPGIAFEAVKRY